VRGFFTRKAVMRPLVHHDLANFSRERSTDFIHLLERNHGVVARVMKAERLNNGIDLIEEAMYPRTVKRYAGICTKTRHRKERMPAAKAKPDDRELAVPLWKVANVTLMRHKHHPDDRTPVQRTHANGAGAPGEISNREATRRCFGDLIDTGLSSEARNDVTHHKQTPVAKKTKKKTPT
jgi:hypothetical protein